MDYALIFILELIGIGLYVMKIVLELDKKSPDDSKLDVLKLFWNLDGFTLIISGIILVFNEVFHLIMEMYGQKAIAYVDNLPYINYHLVSFIIAFLLGYFGQAKIYGWLGKAEVYIDKKIESKLQ